MYRFILIFCLMGGLFGLNAAESQIQLQGTGTEKNVEDFKDHVPMLQRHFELSQLFIKKYGTILLTKEYEIIISSVEKYMQLDPSSSENTKNQIKDLEKNNLVIRSMKKAKNANSNFDIQKELKKIYFMYEFFHAQTISFSDSLTTLKKSLTHSVQCLNAANETLSSQYVKQIKNICSSSKYTIEKMLSLEQTRLNMSHSEKCNHEIKCLSYQKLTNQMRNQFNELTIVGANNIGNDIFGWRDGL